MNPRRLQITRLLVSLLFVGTMLVPLGTRPGSVLAQGGSQTFSETGKTVSGKFLDYWNSHGGLAQQGYPISDQMQEVSDTDGKTYTVQYFERAVFEQHPENQPPNDVLLSLLGTFLYNQKYPNGAPNQTPNNNAGSQLFDATSYRVGGKFLDYWNSHGGLAQQGYPISDEFQEKSDLDGKTYTVQYFERAVFESHPENQPPYNVLLSQLGTFRFRAKYAQRPIATQEPAPTSTPAPIPTATTKPLDRRIVATIPVGTSPGFMAAGAGMIWLEMHNGLQRIDPVTNQVTTITAVTKPGPKVVSDGALWAIDNFSPDSTGGDSAVLKKIDPSTGTVEATIPLGDCCGGMTATPGAIWLGSFNKNRILKVSTQTNSIVSTFPVVAKPLGMAAGAGSIWVCNHAASNKDSILRIDANTNAITDKIDLGDQLNPGGIIYTDDGVWVASWNSSTDHDVISRIDPRTDQVIAKITYTTNLVFTLAAAGGSIWAIGADSMLLRVDPQSNALIEKIAVGHSPLGLAAIGNILWVANGDDNTVMKLDLTR